MRKHLAIFSDPAVRAIFKGVKRIESRFSQRKIAPFGRIGVGDTVYIKPSGKEIAGQFTVSKVISFESVNFQDWEIIKQHFWPQISLGDPKLDEQFWQDHQQSSYATLIFIARVERFITSPTKFKKTDRRAWVVLEDHR